MENNIQPEENTINTPKIIPESMFSEEQWEDIACDTRTPAHVLDAICDWGSAYLQHLAIANPNISSDTLERVARPQTIVVANFSPHSAAAHFFWKRSYPDSEQRILKGVSEYVLSAPSILCSLSMDEETPPEILDTIAPYCDEFGCKEIIDNPQVRPRTLAFLASRPEKKVSILAKKKLKEILGE